MEALKKYYVKLKRFNRVPVPRILLNSSINYITPNGPGSGVRASMKPVESIIPIYEVIPMHEGTWFKIVRLDVYPPRTIATFKPKLYVKAKSGFEPYIGSVREP